MLRQALAGCFAASLIAIPALAQAPLAAPRFHHLELNTVDPDAAIAFYVKQFPVTARTEWEGKPALSSPDNVLIVFNKVRRPPAADPNVSAYWHFGWNVVDSRLSLETFRAQDILVPFYTDEHGAHVGISSDTYPYPPGVPGRTRAQLAEAQAQNLTPRRIAGNGYVAGPDGAIVEFTGNAPAERVDHIHMWQEDSVCAQLWYQTHLLATPRRTSSTAPLPAAADCRQARSPEPSWPSLTKEGTYRAPTGGVSFSGVAVNWYPNQTGKPLVPSTGRLMDHIGLAVADLDAWLAKLRGEGVRILRRPTRVGGTRAMMIEGPSREVIELVEVK